MPARIQHKRSSVAANIPSAGDLQIGELALNFADRYLYTKNGASAVIRMNGFVPLALPVDEVAGDSYLDTTDGKFYAYYSFDGDPIAWHEIAPAEDLSGFLEKTGGVMTGQIILPGGAAGNQAVHFNQMNTLITSSLVDYVKKDGSVAMTGHFTLFSSSPVNPLHAASKQYVDDAVAIATPDLSDFLEKIGGVMTGQITLPGGGTGNQAATANELASAIAAHVSLPDPHTQYATVVESQLDVLPHATGVGGTANAIELTFTPALAAYTNRMRIRWTSAGANTSTAPTVDIGAAGVKTIKKGTGVALAPGDTGASGYVCEAVYNNTDFILQNPVTELDTVQFSASDEATNLTAGTSKVTYHCPFAFTLLDIFAALTAVQTGGSALIVDIHKNGTTIFGANKLVFDNNEDTTLTSASAVDLSIVAFVKGDKLTVDIDQVGTASAKGLKIYMNVARFV